VIETKNYLITNWFLDFASGPRILKVTMRTARVVIPKVDQMCEYSFELGPGNCISCDAFAASGFKVVHGYDLTSRLLVLNRSDIYQYAGIKPEQYLVNKDYETRLVARTMRPK
jgi:hypothetical protein